MGKIDSEKAKTLLWERILEARDEVKWSRGDIDKARREGIVEGLEIARGIL